MSSYKTLKKDEIEKGNYSLVFYVGHGYYQCFRTWKDFLSRDKKADKKELIVFTELKSKTTLEIRKIRK